MNAEDARKELTISGIECRVRSGEVQIRVCYYCGNDRWNLEMNPARGVFHCWACSESGRADYLIRTLTGTRVDIAVSLTGEKRTRSRGAEDGDIPNRPAWEADLARHYLRRRGFDGLTAQRYGLAVAVDKEHRLVGRILIPQQDFWTGEHLGWVARTYCNQRPKYLTTLSTRQVIGWRVRERGAPFVFVEGSFDGIAVHRADVNACVLSGVGAGDVLEFVSRIPEDAAVFVLLDPEAETNAAALSGTISNARRTWGAAPARNITLPAGRDPADFAPEALRMFLYQMSKKD